MYITHHVKYHIILGNLMGYGYQSLEPGQKVSYLLNGIRHNELSTVIATVWSHSDKYEQEFDAIVAFLTQNIDKQGPILRVKIISVAQSRPATKQKTIALCSTFKDQIQLKKYSREEYDLMLIAQQQQLYELQLKIGLLKGRRPQKAVRFQRLEWSCWK